MSDDKPPMPPVAAAEPVPAPEPSIGTIVDPTAAAPKLVAVPPPDILAKFPPPPPIAVPLADKSVGLGLLVGIPAPAPEPPPATPPAPPVVGKKFHELSSKTQFEIREGWELANPGRPFDAEHWQEPVHQAAPPVTAILPREAPLNPVVADIDLSKLSPRTRAELEEGAQAIARRNADYAAVVQVEKERAAARLKAGERPTPDAMSYNERQ